METGESEHRLGFSRRLSLNANLNRLNFRRFSAADVHERTLDKVQLAPVHSSFVFAECYSDYGQPSEVEAAAVVILAEHLSASIQWHRAHPLVDYHDESHRPHPSSGISQQALWSLRRIVHLSQSYANTSTSRGRSCCSWPCTSKPSHHGHAGCFTNHAGLGCPYPLPRDCHHYERLRSTSSRNQWRTDRSCWLPSGMGHHRDDQVWLLCVEGGC